MLRYGENPHQAAALYVDPDVAGGLATADQLHGKEMSFNNYVDADAACRAASDFADPAVAIVKHANPCGIAVGAPDAADPVADAHRKAHACDPVSAFGGVIAVNRPVTVAMAEQVAEVFTEVVVAPGYLAGSLEVLAAKKIAAAARGRRRPAGRGGVPRDQRRRAGADRRPAGRARRRRGGLDGWPPASRRTSATLADLVFAWRAVRAVKSNAILLGRDRATRRASAWARSTGSTRPGSRWPGPATGRPARWPPPTRSSRSPDGLQVLARRPGCGRWCSRAGRSATRRWSPRPRRPGSPLYLTGTRHFAH